MPAHIEVRGLKTYLDTRLGTVRAVDGVSFAIQQGEIFGLVGESGSGKSTLCLSLLRLLPKTARVVEGEILLQGVNLLTLSERSMVGLRGRRMSMILQDPMTSLDPVFTVGSQLEETIRLEKPSTAGAVRERVAALMRLVHIPSAATRLRNYPHQLSGGTRQRVVGAIALAREPHFLIADEPTSSLDVITQANYLRLLKRARDEVGLTILLVSHDFSVISRMCDRVGVMYAGKLVEVGTAAELFARPQHPYTRALLQAVPRVDVKLPRLLSIEGQPPALFERVPGCPFAPRCPSVMAQCREQFPPEVERGAGHTVSCWLHVAEPEAAA